ncbi:6-hydroxytryprostatin B O-methyltransferase [Daldinia childiae]|uniref:6-hydroxytryprostatin B O-methyltransferase n=1 Tax=Daldinia childiae TaxID=326645 RepID=UPI001446D09A|nr:6-hydroxytryprostatin B O-methyltransferase [Daldinia childiae]KAF3058615.1 6-hydroxytryprostatin B O-methyltransferase [Daldinia childiae]
MPSNKDMPLPRIVELAATVSDSVAKIQQVLLAKGAPWPSFDENAPDSLPKEATEAQNAVIDAAAELYDLMLDPLTLVYKHSGGYQLTGIQVIGRYEIAKMVPAGGQISYGEIAKQTSLSEHIFRRLLRHAMTLRFFCEPQPGMVAHTKASKLLSRPDINSFMSFSPEIGWPSALRLLDALEKWPESQEPNETAFSLANNNEGSLYEVFARYPEKALRFAAGMSTFAVLPSFGLSSAIDGYDWAALGRARVVDIGGSQGSLAVALAKRFPDLSFVVQDMPEVVEGAGATLPSELRGRISFMAHDFFKPQTVRADAYLLRTILHNWSDKYCFLILHALVPALKHGTKILINEICLSTPGAIPAHLERDIRSHDLGMRALFNSQERDLQEWKDLLAAADRRFVFQGISQVPRSALAVIEVIWDENA